MTLMPNVMLLHLMFMHLAIVFFLQQELFLECTNMELSPVYEQSAWE